MSLAMVLLIAEIIAAVILAVLFIKSRLPEKTIDQQKRLIDALSGRVDELTRSHNENREAIAELNGQIRVYKELPLQEIAKSLQILETLPANIQTMQQESNKALITYFKENHFKPATA